MTNPQKKLPSEIAALLGLTLGKQKRIIEEIQLIQTVGLFPQRFSLWSFLQSKVGKGIYSWKCEYLLY